MGAEGSLRERAEAFRALHHGPSVLVLANAWDVASARVMARVPGCRALATTSAGIAGALGYPDGQHVPAAEMLAAVTRIAAAVDVPVTADLEAGYASDDEGVAATARAALAAGAVGINLEDVAGEGAAGGSGLLARERAEDRIRAVRAAADAVGVPLVVNARTDVFLAGVGRPADRFDHAVERVNAYLAAGADCAFIPGVSDADTIGGLVRAVDGPLNVLAVPGAPPVAELERLGVARVSVGSGPMRATLALVQRIAADLYGRGTYDALSDAVSYAGLNALLGER